MYIHKKDKLKLLFWAQWMVQLRIQVEKHMMKYEFLPTVDHR